MELNVCLILCRLDGCHPSWEKTMKEFTVVLGKCIMRAPGLISEHLYYGEIRFDRLRIWK